MFINLILRLLTFTLSFSFSIVLLLINGSFCGWVLLICHFGLVSELFHQRPVMIRRIIGLMSDHAEPTQRIQRADGLEFRDLQMA
jgi:hypothetical protein